MRRRTLVAATVAGTLLAGGVVWALAASILIVRSKLPGRWAIDAIAMLPLAVPGLVLAFGYLAISVSLKQRLGTRLSTWLRRHAKVPHGLVACQRLGGPPGIWQL